MRRALAIAGACRLVRRRACAGLAVEADPLHRAQPARRADRHTRAPDRAEARGKPGPARRHRKPRRRGRQHRHRSGGQSAAGRLHAGDRQQRDVRRQREPLQAAGFRSGQGFRAGRAGGDAAEYSGRASFAAGNVREGTRRARQSAAGAAQLFRLGHGRGGASGGGAFQEHDRQPTSCTFRTRAQHPR